MLDHLATLVPSWAERNPADLGQALVEVLAYAADYLSYYQDAVATEAYLGTARRRRSVKRHARLLDYVLHEGCNARVWVQVRVTADDVHLPKGSQLLTRLAGSAGVVTILADSPAYGQALAQRPQVFETMHDIRLYQAHNEMSFHAAGPVEQTLPPGTTGVTLQDEWLDPPHHTRRKLDYLKVGDVLIFEQVRDPETGTPVDPGMSRSHPLRISKLTRGINRDTPVVTIEWPVADALALFVTRFGPPERSGCVGFEPGSGQYCAGRPWPNRPGRSPAPGAGKRPLSSPPAADRPDPWRTLPASSGPESTSHGNPGPESAVGHARRALGRRRLGLERQTRPAQQR